MRQLKIIKQITDRSDASIDKYLQDINKLDLISAEEEVELSLKIKSGDQIALDKLVTSNLRFVVSVAKQYQNQGLNLSDLINEGNLGLIKAAKRFDETRGFKFISYAVWWIRQGIVQAIAENSRVVRLPLNKIGSINKINRAQAELEQGLQRPATSAEIAKHLDTSIKDVETGIKSKGRYLSMDSPLKDGENFNMYSTMASNDEPNPDHELIKSSLEKDIDTILSILTPREKNVLVLTYGLGGIPSKSLKELSDYLKITPERVRQIREYALRRLRDSCNLSVLKTYMG
ncbi:sigma-70 family RNA polymerase sigma factor [Zunongwangia endophytica]|uniref:RNA polymerase sigma factor RpoD/SigA n=1 Tax=Zunongwangia endophytica TaxID=1808945 RepID=A0ABV8H484_9FLAO|nr:RNA polymerase sigma factor RpoD/SigA [Zunongwangia endophytica]MDN3594464.1 RNA polymerase sigma factor RpoD/SigA [Zunongwangia endophytica]